MAAIEEELAKLDQEAMQRVEDTLRLVNIALKLNLARMRAPKTPVPLARLQEWKRTLEFWKEMYGQPTRDPELMAERLGQLYSLCARMQSAA